MFFSDVFEHVHKFTSDFTWVRNQTDIWDNSSFSNLPLAHKVESIFPKRLMSLMDTDLCTDIDMQRNMKNSKQQSFL